jgi:hypothetical protein
VAPARVSFEAKQRGPRVGGPLALQTNSDTERSALASHGKEQCFRRRYLVVGRVRRWRNAPEPRRDCDPMKPGLWEIVDQRWSAPAWLALFSTVAGVTLLGALSVHHSCAHPPPPVVSPDPGTPLADFCSVVDTGVPWLHVVIAVGLFGAIVVAAGFRARWAFGAAMAICAGVVVGAIVAANLTSAWTV